MKTSDNTKLKKSILKWLDIMIQTIWPSLKDKPVKIDQGLPVIRAEKGIGKALRILKELKMIHICPKT